MKKVDITPLAHNDIERLNDYLLGEFGEKTSKKVLGAIYDDLEKLSVFPDMGVNILAKYGIVSDYLCLITHKNYAFYRIEGDYIRIIRVLDERQDFLRILFGIITTSEETENYWNE